MKKGLEAYLSEEMDDTIFEGFEGALHEMMKVSQWADDVKLIQEAGILAEHFHTMFRNFRVCVALRDSQTDASTISAVNSIANLQALLESLGAWRSAYSNPSLQLLGVELAAASHVAKIASALRLAVKCAMDVAGASTKDELMTATSKFEAQLESFSNDAPPEEATKLKKQHDELATAVDQATARLSKLLGCQDDFHVFCLNYLLSQIFNL